VERCPRAERFKSENDGAQKRKPGASSRLLKDAASCRSPRFRANGLKLGETV